MPTKHENSREREMAASPVNTGPVPWPPELQQPQFFPDILPIYILKVERDAGEKLAEMAANCPPPPVRPMQLANVDDPTSPPLRNNATPSAGAYQAAVDVVPPPPPMPTPDA